MEYPTKNVQQKLSTITSNANNYDRTVHKFLKEYPSVLPKQSARGLSNDFVDPNLSVNSIFSKHLTVAGQGSRQEKPVDNITTSIGAALSPKSGINSLLSIDSVKNGAHYTKLSMNSNNKTSVSGSIKNSGMTSLISGGADFSASAKTALNATPEVSTGLPKSLFGFRSSFGVKPYQLTRGNFDNLYSGRGKLLENAMRSADLSANNGQTSSHKASTDVTAQSMVSSPSLEDVFKAFMLRQMRQDGADAQFGPGVNSFSPQSVIPGISMPNMDFLRHHTAAWNYPNNAFSVGRKPMFSNLDFRSVGNNAGFNQQNQMPANLYEQYQPHPSARHIGFM